MSTISFVVKSYCEYYSPYIISINYFSWFIYKRGTLRRKLFNKNFYEKHSPQYKKLVNVMKLDEGYLDDGQRRLADQLNDEQWFIFTKMINYRN